MIPRDAQLLVEGKIKKRDREFERLDHMFANQTRKLINMINLRGKGLVLSDDTDVEACLTYQWEPPKIPPPSHEEMTEEDMENFDRNMDTYRGVRNG